MKNETKKGDIAIFLAILSTGVNSSPSECEEGDGEGGIELSVINEAGGGDGGGDCAGDNARNGAGEAGGGEGGGGARRSVSARDGSGVDSRFAGGSRSDLSLGLSSAFRDGQRGKSVRGSSAPTGLGGETDRG